MKINIIGVAEFPNKNINGVYRIKSFYMAQCGVCGRQHFTDRHRSAEAVEQMKGLGWSPYQDGEGEIRLRCPDCHDKVDWDPLPESEEAGDPLGR